MITSKTHAILTIPPTHATLIATNGRDTMQEVGPRPMKSRVENPHRRHLRL